MRKIKVLHIVHDFLNGGIESFLYYLSQQQINNSKLEVAILCLQKQLKVTNTRISESNIKCHYIPIQAKDLSINRYFQILKLTNTYDIIHFHTFKPLLSFFLHFTKAQKVITVHSAGDIGRPASFQFKLKNKFFETVLNKSMNLIAHNSYYTKNYWKNRGVNGTNNFVVYNGVPNVNKHNVKNVLEVYPDLENEFIIGTTSRFIPWKRVELLVNAFSKTANKHNMKLLLVGDGPDKEKIENLIKSKNLDTHVIITGFRSNVTDYQAVMDVCVFPSVSEPFGLVAIECLLLGKPVFVMQDGGGITELIKDIEPQNIARSESHLVDLMDTSYLNRRAITLNATNRVKAGQNYSVENTEKQYFDLYKQLIGNS